MSTDKKYEDVDTGIKTYILNREIQIATFENYHLRVCYLRRRLHGVTIAAVSFSRFSNDKRYITYLVNVQKRT